MKPKTFGNVKLATLKLDSGDTSVGILLTADSEAFHCTVAAHFGETASFAGDVDASSGELKAKDVDIIAGGGLTIAASAPVDCDSTDVSFAKANVADLISASADFVALQADEIDFTETTAFADNAAAVAGGLTAGDIYHTSTGEMRIVV